MGYRLITGPAADPIKLAEAKLHLRVDHSDDDVKIASLIKAATAHVDGRSGILGRCLVTQTWELTLDEFPDGEIEIPLGPVASITSIKYRDASNVEQTLSSALYTFDDTRTSAYVVPVDDWPATYDVTNAVTVRFIAGTAVASIPEAIRHAMLLLIGHWYEERNAVNVGNISSVLPFTVEALLAPYRRVFT